MQKVRVRLQKPAEQVNHLLQHAGHHPPPFVVVQCDPPGIFKILPEDPLNLPAERLVVDDEVDFEITMKAALIDVG